MILSDVACYYPSQMMNSSFLMSSFHVFFFILAVIPVAAATMTPLPLLTALIFMKVKGYFTKNDSTTTSSIDGHTDETESPIIKTKIVLDDMVESESTQKLVNGDANDNLVV